MTNNTYYKQNGSLMQTDMPLWFLSDGDVPEGFGGTVLDESYEKLTKEEFDELTKALTANMPEPERPQTPTIPERLDAIEEGQTNIELALVEIFESLGGEG